VTIFIQEKPAQKPEASHQFEAELFFLLTRMCANAKILQQSGQNIAAQAVPTFLF
jgi:hypothetical protein